MKVPIVLIRKFLSKPKLLRFYVLARENGKDRAGYFKGYLGYPKSTYYRLLKEAEKFGLIHRGKIISFAGRKLPVSDFFLKDDKTFQVYLFVALGRIHAEKEERKSYYTDRHGVRTANRSKTSGLAVNESEVSVSYLSKMTGLSVGKVVELKKLAQKYKILDVRQRRIISPEGIFSKKGGYCYLQATDILTFKVKLK